MTTLHLHAPIERHRFAAHVLASLGGWLGATRRAVRDDVDPRHADALKVREMAYAYSKTDPGFAADLYAAAARHEGMEAD